MNDSLLRKLMSAKGFTQEKLANVIGVDRSTLNRKLGGVGKKGFGIQEMHQIVRALQMTRMDILNVFFPETTV